MCLPAHGTLLCPNRPAFVGLLSSALKEDEICPMRGLIYHMVRGLNTVLECTIFLRNTPEVTG